MGDLRPHLRCSGCSVFGSYSLIIVAFEGSGRFIAAAIVTAVAVLVQAYLVVLPGSKESRSIEMWAAGHEVDPMTALGATFAYARRAAIRSLAINVVWAPLLGVVVGGIAGATSWRLVQYAIVGAAYGGCHWGNRYAQFRGRSAAAGKGRPGR